MSVHLFGPLRVLREGEPVILAGRNEQRLLALLALRSPHAVDRRQAAAKLWPSVSFQVGGNRLRTALVALRRELGSDSTLQADRQSISLGAAPVETDLSEAAHWEARANLAANPEEELLALLKFAERVGPGLLPDWSDEWLADEQIEWRIRRQEALVRAAELALRSQDFEQARAAAEAVLSENPADGFAWSPYLIASARLGQGKGAVRRFNSARRALHLDEQEDFDAPLIHLAKAVLSGAYAPTADLPELPAGADAMLGQAFRRLVQIEPDLAANVVCSDAFRLEVLRSPQTGIELLEFLLEELQKRDIDLVALRLMTLRTHSLLHEIERVLELGEALLEVELDPSQRRLVLTLLSYSHFLTRNLNRAFELVDRAIVVADEHSPPHHRHLTRADRALYVWHQGNDAEALATLVSVFEATKDESEAKVSYAPAYLCGLIGSIHAFAGELEAAETWLKRGYSLAKIPQYREQVHQIELPLGYLLAAKGAIAEGARLLISGLGHSVQGRNVRAFAAGVDWAGAVFAAAGDSPMARACLDWGERCRLLCRHGRTVAENRFVDRLKAGLGSEGTSNALAEAETPRQAFEVISARLSAAAKAMKGVESR